MIGVVGLGQIGMKLASRMGKIGNVLAVDTERGRLDTSGAAVKIKGTVFENLDKLKKCDVILVALPGSIAFENVKKLLSLGIPVVDISFFNEDPYELDAIARSSGSLYIPDAGFAPGLSNIFAYRVQEQYRPSSIDILVGGLPISPSYPFWHSVTWSAEGLIDEYTRPAGVVRNGKREQIDPLAAIGEAPIEGLGYFETFYSDGLRTLLRTLSTNNVCELTLRYKGHLQLMKLLRDLGYFSDTGKTIPRKATEEVFNKYRTNSGDFSVLEVRSDGEPKITMLDRQSIKGESSMSRLTSLPAAVIADFILKGRLEGTGIYEPEKLAEDSALYSGMLNAIRDEGISLVTES